jgi:hypothetical protein
MPQRPVLLVHYMLILVIEIKLQEIHSGKLYAQIQLEISQAHIQLTNLRVQIQNAVEVLKLTSEALNHSINR